MLLYKYLPLTWSEQLTESEKNLNEQRCYCVKANHFWFSKPDLLNDPYDCRPFFKNIDDLNDIELLLEDLDTKELRAVLKSFPRCKTKRDIIDQCRMILNSNRTSSSVKVLTKFIPQVLVSSIVNAKIANIGILSITADSSSCLMWSHYANNHRGICLEIDFPESTHSLRKVRYTKEQPIVAIYEAMNENHGKFEDLFYTKSKHWEYEREWRMVARKGNLPSEIPGVEIKQIIYGINTSEQTKAKILEVTENSIPTRQMTMKRNYELELGT